MNPSTRWQRPDCGEWKKTSCGRSSNSEYRIRVGLGDDAHGVLVPVVSLSNTDASQNTAE